MSTMGTTLSSLLVGFLAWPILPPSTLERSKRLAGRLPGVTIAMG